ncbi:MAG: MGMT family protein [Candidatus Pacebacteria bacterium]|nr:MGMT family protein [Candidatus Paceibacterota bacterium]
MVLNSSSSSFSQRVLRVVSRIHKGETLTYKQVACRAGSPLAYRAVGNILNTNYDSRIPCHRVVRSDGTAGGYNRGVAVKKKLLEKEKNKVIFSRRKG